MKVEKEWHLIPSGIVNIRSHCRSRRTGTDTTRQNSSETEIGDQPAEKVYAIQMEGKNSDEWMLESS